MVVSQYLGSLRAAADVKAAQSRVDLAKALVDQATDLAAATAPERASTRCRANVQYQNEQQRLIDSQTQLKTSLYGLARLLNLDPQQQVELADESEFFQTPDFSGRRNDRAGFRRAPGNEGAGVRDPQPGAAEERSAGAEAAKVVAVRFLGAPGLDADQHDSVL